MNRHKRRAAGKQPAPATLPAPAIAPVVGYSGKPGFVLRMFAKVLLSKWVLKRVNHSDIRRVLASLAAQAGRTDLSEILRRQDPAG